MAITDRDLQEWAHHPVTKHFKKMLVESKQATMEAWAAQAYPDPVSNAGALGGIDCMEKVMAIIDEWGEIPAAETYL